MDEALRAFDTEWKTGSRTRAREMAEAYVAAHPELVDKFGDLTIPELVALVDLARKEQVEAERIAIDIWLLVEFEPQRIGGLVDVGGGRTVSIKDVEALAGITPAEGVRRQKQEN